MMPPKSGIAPKQAVVLLHGYGSNGDDLIGLAPYWRDLLPDALFIAPNGPEPALGGFGGYQWFPVDHDRPDYRFAGASAAKSVIARFLADLWAQTGISPENTLLGGFSQGAMTALHVGVSLNVRLMGILGFSGAFIAPAGFLEGTGPQPPVCLIHGEADTVVDPRLSDHAATILRGRGFDVRLQLEPGVGHTITADGVSFASAFLTEIAGKQ
jgi:phospholipase/carboxylesterase